MTDREIPILGDPPKKTKNRIKVSRSEVLQYLERKRIPLTKISRKRARAKLRKRKEKQAIPRGRDVSYIAPDAPRQIIYGDMRVGGLISFMQTSNGKRDLNMIITISGHEIESIDDLYLDSNLVSFSGNTANGGTKPDGDPIDYTGKVYWETTNLGTTSQTSYDLSLPSLWTSNHQQKNCSHIFLKLTWDGTLFPDGIPDIEIEAHGKKLYDPRTTTTVWSNNAALVIADYLTDSVYGVGYPWTAIDTSTDVGGLQWAADICDESVLIAAGGALPRYPLNAVYDMDMSHDEILAEMETAFAGSITWSNGTWKFWPGKYLTPSITLTDDDLRGSPQLESMISRRDNFNSIRGTFVSGENSFEVTDFPPLSISSEVTLDGEEVFEDVSLPATTRQEIAQRIAMIELRRIREAVTVRAPFSIKALSLEAGDTVYLTLDRYGWSSKVFEVHDLELSIDEKTPEIVVDLQLRETSSSVYSWDETQDENNFTPSTNTDLPDPFSVDPPTGLTLESGTNQLLQMSDGTIFTRLRVTWTAPDDGFVESGGEIQIQVKQTAFSTWFPVTPVLGDQTEAFIYGLKDGVSHDVRIRAVSALGVVSSWVTEAGHTVIGKTAPPSNITGFSGSAGSTGISLSWDAVTDTDFARYEIRRGATWGTATVVAKLVGTAYVDPYFVTGSITYLIKAIDTTGNASTTATSAVVVPAAAGAVTTYVSQVIDNNVLLNWDPPASGSFAVDYYNVYKGTTAISANLLGRVYGTFFTYFTLLGETAKFWVEAVDVGGTKGTATSKDVSIYPPPDYLLRAIDSPDIADGTLNSYAVEESSSGQGFIAPTVSGETWTTHFSNNSYTTVQDFIDGGFSVWATPSDTGNDGQWYVEVDLGVVVSGSRINLSYSVDALAGSPTVTPTISYKELSGDPYTDNAGVNEVFATNFRYVKLTLDVDDGADDTALARVSNIQWRIDVKKQTDSGNATSTASGGTTVSFNLDFLDVDSIQVTAKGSSSGKYFPVYDFTDVPNPTDFDVYIFDSGGTQVAVDFSWTAEGAINPT